MKARSGCVLVAVIFRLLFIFETCSAQDNTVNVALHKNSRMSSRYRSSGPAGNAVNGNTEGQYNPNNCAHTDSEDNSPWWEVDLNRRYFISNLTVWARINYEYRMAGTNVLVDGQLCFSFDDTYTTESNPQIRIECGSRLVGQIVRLEKNSTSAGARQEALNLCEVQVFACSDPYWGDGCNSQCGHCLDGEVCDKVDGHCTDCSAGFMLPTCVQGCADGTYGMACADSCSVGCQDLCDEITGECTCSPGWNGSKCENECSDGNYGIDCVQLCSEGCKDFCDKATGDCNCRSGWTGLQCQEASSNNTGLHQTCCTCRPNDVMPIVGAVIAVGLAIIIVNIILGICWLRRRSQPRDKGTELNNSHHPWSSATTLNSNHGEPPTSLTRNLNDTNFTSSIQELSSSRTQLHSFLPSTSATTSTATAAAAEEADARGDYENVPEAADTESRENYDSVGIYQNKDIHLYTQLQQ